MRGSNERTARAGGGVRKMKILLDAMGGDNAPLEIMRGAVMAAQDSALELMLIGRASDMERCASENGIVVPENVSLVNAEETVTMEDDPVRVVREKKNSSMVRGLELLRDGEADAFISAGSTGALITAATLVVKRIKGVRRGAIAIEFPAAEDKTVLIVDCGANARCTSEYLTQFAYMGSAYMQSVRGINNPKVALLNIGEEETKGTDLQRETYAKLKEAAAQGRINFIGNIEARYVEQGTADVIVTDGYSGNILLKATEGTAMFMTSLLKGVFLKGVASKLCYLVLKKGLKGFKAKMDYTEYGGTPILGLSKPVIKAHGSSDAKAIFSAVRQAKICVQSDVAGKIAESLGGTKITDRS